MLPGVIERLFARRLRSRKIVEQLALPAPGLEAPRTLVDDETGTIRYEPSVVDALRCDAWFVALRGGIDWQRERRPMYDRVVDVPRLTGSFSAGDTLPPAIAEAKAAVERHLRVRFDSVGLNLYRDGDDSVAMHNDHAGEIVPRSPIALLSLGSARVMRIHSKARPRRVFQIALEPGSILLMSGASQEHWEHGIPKTRAPVGARISLAFRQRHAF
jgi:alkylated DNA repair dioxygenase AlkB